MRLVHEAAGLFLLALPALISIVNPLGGAFVFLASTRWLGRDQRELLARWVAIHSFALLTVSISAGAWVLTFFGITVPVLRVAGGIVIALAAWGMLNAKEDEKPSVDISSVDPATASRLAFYPLTMPVTVGPGSISVAVALGTSREPGVEHLVPFLIGSLLTTVLICLTIYVAYRFSDRVSEVVGPTGTTIAMRLTSFLLFCIGLQVLWNGVAELALELRAR